MGKTHEYAAMIIWSAEPGAGTTGYDAYSRAHRIEIAGKPPLEASADPMFRGDRARHNPEDLLVAALASCHMLWYLHLCADAGVVVTHYEDTAEGTMVLERRGGRFVEVVLHPVVTITADSNAQTAERLHEEAHAACFIAQSMNFSVRHAATIRTVPAAS